MNYSTFSNVVTLLLWSAFLVWICIKVDEEAPEKKSNCVEIQQTQIIKMSGHLQFDQCYVITTDSDDNVELHTILCADTLGFHRESIN